MPGQRITPRQWERLKKLVSDGMSIRAASSQVGISYASARTFFQNGAEVQTKTVVKTTGGQRQTHMVVADKADKATGKPIEHDDLCPEAQRALEDFGYFQERYLGRLATPWQVDAANQIAALLDTEEKEYVVLNAPPGAGKSTTFTHDIPLWLTCKRRHIRGLIGSRTQRQADAYTARLVRSFERTVPVQASDEEKQKGLAVDAVATVAEDFGRFKPVSGEKWTRREFVVEQFSESIDEKESTWAAYGFDSGYLGMRYDFVIWDDLVDRTSMRTVEAKERLEGDWDDIAEKRLEPGGLLVLQGQRLGPQDLYRYCLDKPMMVDDDDEDMDLDVDTTALPRKYKHIVYRAHYEDQCNGDHSRAAAYAMAGGCLLDPRRLTWRDLRAEMANPRQSYLVVYQQEDSAPEDNLVRQVWIDGGTDPATGEFHPGCFDEDRGLWELPRGLWGQWLYVASVDPSPTRYWSIQFWAIRYENGIPKERFLIDHHRGKMSMPGFLDARGDQFIGLAEDWQARSELMNMKISNWIIEINAAQRFMLQTDTFKRWASHHGINFVPHTTSTNKADPDYGIEMLGPLFKTGQIRLPRVHHGEAYWKIKPLLDEVTHWPNWSTDDTVMSMWFVQSHAHTLAPRTGPPPKLKTAPEGVLRNAATFIGRQWAGQSAGKQRIFSGRS